MLKGTTYYETEYREDRALKIMEILGLSHYEEVSSSMRAIRYTIVQLVDQRETWKETTKKRLPADKTNLKVLLQKLPLHRVPNLIG